MQYMACPQGDENGMAAAAAAAAAATAAAAAAAAVAALAAGCPTELAACVAIDTCAAFLGQAMDGDIPTAEAAAAVGPETSALLKCYMYGAAAASAEDASGLEETKGSGNGE